MSLNLNIAFLFLLINFIFINLSNFQISYHLCCDQWVLNGSLYFLCTTYNLIVLWSENMTCLIPFIWKIVGFVLWPSVWSAVVVIAYVFKKNVFFSSDSILDETMLA